MNVNFFGVLSIIILIIIGRYRFNGMQNIENAIENLDDKDMKKGLRVVYDIVKLFSNFLFYFIGIIYILVLLVSKQVTML